MIRDDQTGVKPLFRDRSWNQKERAEEKENKRVNWYKAGKGTKNKMKTKEIDYKSVLFVPVTKGGTLAKELQKREEEINKYTTERIKIIEDGGLKMKDLLVKKDPFPNDKCSKKKCIICESEIKEHLKISCNSNSVRYLLKC